MDQQRTSGSSARVVVDVVHRRRPGSGDRPRDHTSRRQVGHVQTGISTKRPTGNHPEPVIA